MRYKILLTGFLAALITGCSSTYKAGQTPDDVYFSPARESGIRKEIRNEDRYEDYTASQEDRYLRMKIRDRQRWSSLDDYTYWNDSRYVPSYSYDYYRNNWSNSYYSLNSWNSPYYYSPYNYGGYNFHGYSRPWGYSPYTNVYITKYPKKAAPSVNRPTLSGYNNRNYNNSNNTARPGLGNAIKRALTTPQNNGYNNRNANANNTYKAPERTSVPERTYTPSSSGSSSSGSSSSGSSGGGVTRPPRN